MEEEPKPPPLTYEETPVVEPSGEAGPPPIEQPAPEPASTEHTAPPPPPQREDSGQAPPVAKKSFIRRVVGTVGTFFLFVLLFSAGVWLSGVVKDYFSVMPEQVSVTPSPQPTSAVVPVGSATPSATPAPVGWKTYGVTSGVTRAEISGISYELPAEVLAPICDGTSCASQGTYLPGGTRFTVAPRGAGQVLKDFRGSIISDLRGQAFTVTQTTIAGKKAVAFHADFTGSTAGGYTFAQMRGVMIEVTDTMSLELNHFTPTGLTANFAADDLIFDQILERLSFSTTSSGAMTK